MCSMIEMMESYKNEMELHLKLKPVEDYDVNVVQCEVSVNFKEMCDNSSAAELTNFTDCRTAVMMMRVDSEAAESGSNSDFVDVVRKVAMAVIGEVIVVQETLNSVAVVLGPNVPTSTGSRVVQLVTLARKVTDTVRYR